MISLMILFLHATTWEGMIFEGIKKIIKPEGMLYKAIYGCPICMCPWYGSLIYWLFVGSSMLSWLFTVGAACGLCVIYVVLIDLKDAAIAYIKQQEEYNKPSSGFPNGGL